MFSFFKKTEVVLDCFTYVSHAYDYAKIDYGKKYFPDWWKNTPKTVMYQNEINTPTIKTCSGLIDFYTKGIVIPSWFEMELTLKNDGEKICAINSSFDVDFSSTHARIQFEDFAKHDGENLKFTSVWYFRTKENINFVMSQPTWSIRNVIPSMSMLPGVVNFRYQHHTEINYLLLYDKKETTVSIPPLTPLAIYHPMTEKNIKIKNHLVSKDEWLRLVGVEKLILKKRIGEKTIDKKNIIDNTKCPYHKGEKNEF